MHCFAERSNFMALSQVVNPSLSLRVHFLVTLPVKSQTTRLGLVFHGPSTSLVGPISYSSGAMIEGWELAAALNVLFWAHRTPAVLTVLPHPPLPVVLQEGAMPPSQEVPHQATTVEIIRKSICLVIASLG
jgi:hypothetical protein